MKKTKLLMTVLSICVTIIIVGVIFSFKDNSRLGVLCLETGKELYF